MCWPTAAFVAQKIKSELARLGLRHTFLATDSPDATVFEDLLRDQGREIEFTLAQPRPAEKLKVLRHARRTPTDIKFVQHLTPEKRANDPLSLPVRRPALCAAMRAEEPAK